MGKAARGDPTSLSFGPGGANPARADGANARSHRAPLARAANWAVLLIALGLLGLSAGGYFYHRGQLADIGAKRLRLLVVGPGRLCAGVAAQYDVTTTSVAGQPLATPIEYALFLPGGEHKGFHDKDQTDPQGRLQVRVPAEQLAPGQGRLEIRAGAEGRVEQFVVPLRVEADRHLTQLCLDKPVYRPGETVRYRSLTLRQFGLGPGGNLPIRFEILDPAGAAVPGSRRAGMAQHGVACGEFPLPAGLAPGHYTVVATSLDGSFLAERQSFLVESTPGSPPKRAGTSTAEVEVRFCPEGGELVADMENRVYFVARDARAQPVSLRAKLLNGRNQSLGRIESEHAGMGVFSFQPRAGEQYRLKIEQPANVKTEPALPDASSHDRLVLTAGVGVFEPGRPLEFNVRAAEAGLPLVAAAWCRGVAVGQHAFVTQPNANSVRIALDDAVAGVIRLVVYDYRANPPRPVAERLVYRRPARRLQVRLAEPDRRRLPGQTVELAVSVSDEAGKPAAATLAVTVVDRELWSRGRAGTPSLPTRFLLCCETEAPEDLENADSYLSDDPKVAVALDLLLANQGWRRFAERKLEELRKGGRTSERLDRLLAVQGQAAPPAVLDNLHDIEAKHRDSLDAFRANRSRLLNTLTMVSLFGSAGLVLLVAMLSLMNIAGGIRLWGVAMAVAATCLVLGAILMNPERLQSAGEDLAAFTSNGTEPGEGGRAMAADARPEEPSDTTAEAEDAFPVAVFAYERPAGASGPQGDSPGVLFWHPLLATDPSGKARIRFDLPDRPGVFRLVVDAHTDGGRLGWLAAEIVSGGPDENGRTIESAGKNR